MVTRATLEIQQVIAHLHPLIPKAGLLVAWPVHLEWPGSPENLVSQGYQDFQVYPVCLEEQGIQECLVEGGLPVLLDTEERQVKQVPLVHLATGENLVDKDPLVHLDTEESLVAEVHQETEDFLGQWVKLEFADPPGYQGNVAQLNRITLPGEVYQ